MQNWFGESTTRDNKAYVIKNPSRLLKPKEDPLVIKFRIQYDVTSKVPSLERIRLNGRTICSAATTTTMQQETTTVFYSERVVDKSPRPPSPSPPLTPILTVNKNNSKYNNLENFAIFLIKMFSFVLA